MFSAVSSVPLFCIRFFVCFPLDFLSFALVKQEIVAADAVAAEEGAEEVAAETVIGCVLTPGIFNFVEFYMIVSLSVIQSIRCEDLPLVVTYGPPGGCNGSGNVIYL